MAGLLDGKSALITGGGGGIGRATALAFAREGARVAVADVSGEAARETVAQVNAAGGQALSLEGDVTRDTDVRAMIEGVVGAYGRLDCAFNNAGIAGWHVEAAGKKTAEWSEEAFDRMIAVNLKGVWLCMRHELPQMQAQGGGNIVNTGSIAGLVGLPTSSAYVAAKHGVLGLTKTAAIEYAEANIRVNAVCPGYIKTPMTEETMRRRGEAILAQVPFHRMGNNAELYNRHMMPLLVIHPTLKHYVDLLTQTSFLLWTWNTMVVAVVGTGISLVLGVMLAYPLARMRFAGAGLIAMTVAAIYLVPQPLLFIPLADLINRLDLGNTLSAVILTYPTMLVPFCAWLLLGYFKTVPKELEEAARIDGASRLQTMRRIFLPLCTPGFISAGIFAFTLSQNEFLYALIFLTRSSVRTVPVGVIAELIRGDVFYWGQLMAGALLGSIPVAIIYSFFVEHYVAGLTSGSVKG